MAPREKDSLMHINTVNNRWTQNAIFWSECAICMEIALSAYIAQFQNRKLLQFIQDIIGRIFNKENHPVVDVREWVKSTPHCWMDTRFLAIKCRYGSIIGTDQALTPGGIWSIAVSLIAGTRVKCASCGLGSRLNITNETLHREIPNSYPASLSLLLQFLAR